MTHIFLYGPPGTGKSSVGQALAERLCLPFVDLDVEIGKSAGRTIPQIMDEQGESAFRDLETAALKEALARAARPSPNYGRGESVIALGGGALLRDENRAAAESAGKIILLTAKLETLLERLNADSGRRPLLAEDLREKLPALLVKRSRHYASFPVRLNVDGKPAGQNAQELQIILGRHHLSAMGEYDVSADDISNLTNFPMQNPVIVTDGNVAKFHLEKMRTILQASGSEPGYVVLPAGEKHKNLETVSRLWKVFLESGVDRKSTVIALGGGVVGDITGFAASTFMRGIDWIYAPTTLLAMADASLGGKTGFDLPEGKNLIGSFHPPKFVLADVEFLKTLPEAELISGMAEVVKHGVISDPELFYLCGHGLEWAKNNLEEIVKRAMAVKIGIIEEDPYEKGFRAALNFGHTVGHAVELVSGFRLRHGEAVAIGMAAEAKLAERLAVAAQGLPEAVAETLSALGLPVRIPKELPRGEIIRAMRADKKKNAAAIRFALPAGIGKVKLADVTDLESALE